MTLTPLGDLAVLGAGLAAGTVNAVVGSGSLITFPTLLALGVPALTANVSNTVGLLPGSVSASFGYRRELRGQGAVLRALGGWSLAGGLLGAVLLLTLPSTAFVHVVPFLILGAVALLVVQPRAAGGQVARGPGRARVGRLLIAGVFLTGVYGGYFGAAQGVILIGLLALLLPGSLQQANGVKNVLAALVNAVAALCFVVAGHIAWWPALLIAAGSTVGGQLGARYGRRLSARGLRAVVAVLGVAVAVGLFVAHGG